jgi:hypothetical protein
MKICTKCEQVKNEIEFTKNISRNDGLSYWCKQCCSDYKKLRRIKLGKEVVAEQNKKHYNNSRDNILKTRKIWNQTLSGKFNQYKSTAKRRSIDFNLTFEEFCTFWQKSCVYCGSEIETIGLDRKDNNIGYIMGNVVPCCEICNIMKRNHTHTEFLNHIEKIYKFKRKF